MFSLPVVVSVLLKALLCSVPPSEVKGFHFRAVIWVKYVCDKHRPQGDGALLRRHSTDHCDWLLASVMLAR